MRALDSLAPPSLALQDDPVGLLIGDPAAAVRGVVVALDATLPVAQAAATRGAGMLIAHHPLIYHPLRVVRRDDPIGEIVLFCARHQIAVAGAHTNWDVAPGGINDVLSDLLGLTQARPLQITHREPLVKVAVFVPPDAREQVLDAMAEAGAGAIGDYDRCAFLLPGTGTFRPLPGANPHTDTIGQVERTPEEQLEMVAPEAKTATVVTAMKRAHPYEEVAYDVFPLSNTAAEYGIGRIGRLKRPLSAERFLAKVRRALAFPEVRMAGPRARSVQTVAVCGGAGAFLMGDAIAAGADALATSDVRHHEFVEAEARGFLLLDAGHAATETPGTRELARRLGEALAPQDVPVTFLPENKE